MQPAARLCAVSVDLDEIPHYYAIHALGAPPPEVRHLVYDVALPRCLDFAAELGIPLTFFVVARDLERPENVRRLREALARGHEIANHSKDHLYDLVRRPRAEQIDQVAGARELIEQKLGVRPVGFRAPGYTVSDDLLQIVAESGHLYDSSVFPCPPYYAAKALALAALKLRGKRSASILDDPRVLSAPRQPYRIGRPYTERGDGIWELPVQVTRGPRLPFIGTALVLAGRVGARALTELVARDAFVNLELHGVDFLGAEDGLTRLSAAQPDVRVCVEEKGRTLAGVLQRLGRGGRNWVRLGELGRQLQPTERSA